MPTLANARGRDFVPNLAGALDKTVAGFREEEARDLAKQKQADIDFETTILTGEGFSDADRAEAMTRITVLDPVLGKAIADVQKSGNEEKRAQAKQQAITQSKRGAFISQGKDEAAQKERLRTVIGDMIQKGEDTEKAFKMLETSGDEFSNEVDRMEMMGQELDKIFADPKLTKVEAGDTFIDPKGNVIFKGADIPAGGIEISKLDAAKFTGASLDKAAGPGGKFSDLEFRPEHIAKLKSTGIKMGGTLFTSDEKGNVSANVITVGPDGTEKVKRIPITKKGEKVVARQTGLGAQETSNLRVEEAGKITRAQKIAEFEAKGQSNIQARDNVNVNDALDAADNMPELRQTLDLLFQIETGGTDAIKIKALRAAGLEGADLAELTFNLRKNVLRQLKPTFGAAFTEREGNLLAEIEASEDKSTDGNIRLIKRAIEKADRVLQRGVRSATRQKDQAALDDIKRALEPFEKLKNRPLAEKRKADKAKESKRDTGPKGIPANSTDTGKTKNGKKVFKSPDGRFFIED